MEYNSYESLNGKTLAPGDTVVFTVGETKMKHTVEARYLDNEAEDNGEVFTLISRQSDAEKQFFATQFYGYHANGGGWPECKSNDYAALTRLTLAIFAGIEGVDNGKTVVVETQREIEEVVKTTKVVTESFEMTLPEKFNFQEPNYVKLTREYNAKFVDKNVQVGCQTIKEENVQHFIRKAIKHFGFTPDQLFSE